MICDWNKKVGKNIKVVLSDGSKVSGKLYSITNDHWIKRKPSEPTMNVMVNRGTQSAHFPIRSIVKPVCKR